MNTLIKLSLILMIVFFQPLTAKSQEPAASSQLRTIVVKKGQSIRDLADIYLGDPDLWVEILRVNELDSPADIRPDMNLKLPATAITKANETLKTVQDAIDEASKAGSKIFAPKLITEAIHLQDQAMIKRKTGNWDECLQLAQAALEKAKAANEKSLVQGNVESEAILSERKGTVQSRKPTDDIWIDLPVNSILVEGEKVRTLSESYAEILFKDSKRIRMNENSQVVISKMRMKVLKNEEESSVTLDKGDAYILLDNNSQKKQFDLNVPGISTQIDSKRFRVKTDDTETQFANYDGKLKISSGDSTVILGKNQLSKIGSKDSAAEELLPPPALISPANGSGITLGPGQKNIRFEWESIADVSSYWLEIASDRFFKHVVLNQKNLNEPFFNLDQLQDGVYYWQVATVNSTGFPGVNSKARFFKIINDTTPPYVIIHSPKPDEIVVKSPVRIKGETEQNARLSFEGKSVPVHADGTFEIKHSLRKGVNEILLEAVDGVENITRLKRTIVFAPKTDVAIRYVPSLLRIAPKHFISRDAGFTLVGETEPDTLITACEEDESCSKAVTSECFADHTGRFHLNLRLKKTKTRFALSVISLNNHVTRDNFIVEIDSHPPEIQLSDHLSAVVADKHVRLRGVLSETGRLSIANNHLSVDNSFDTTVELNPNMNLLRLTAQDAAENISFLKQKVILDQHPPEFIKSGLSPQTASGGESLYITVSAMDESGLKNAAEFKIQAGSYVYTGFLKLNKSNQLYEGIVNLPRQAKGEIRLAYVKLSDYAGNEKEYLLK